MPHSDYVSGSTIMQRFQKPIARFLIATMLLMDVTPLIGYQQVAQAATLLTDPSAWVTVTPRPDPMMQNLTIPANAATQGMWSPAYAWPMNGLHNMVLPDGKVLTFGTDASGNAQDGRLFDIWDPSLGFGASSHNSSYQAAQQDSFCATATYLNNGNMLISGGNAGNGGFGRGSVIYNPITNTRSTAAAVTALPRWYSTMITLPDSRKLMLGGMVPYTEGMFADPSGAIARGEPSMTPEIYENGAWRSLFGANSRLAFGPDYLRTSFPHAFVAPNGQVFGISADRMWYLDANANGGSGAVYDYGQFKPPYGNKPDPDNVGALSVAVMYDIGKIIQVGGNGGFNGDGFPASNKATSIDINGVAPVLTELPRMSIPRRYGNGIVLANGEVVITGGTRRGNDAGGNEVFAAEIWNPTTNTWRIGANASTIRVYHSITSLLLNGTIISTGGGTPGPVLNRTGEVYYPPYLFEQVGTSSRLATRPVIRGISGLKYANGATVQMDVESTSAISGLSLIALSNGTHSFNNGQRRIPLQFTQEDNRLTATIPNANLTPPGYYQVVVLNAQGVPSYANVVAVGEQMAAPQVATTPYNPGSATPPPANIPPTVALTAPASGAAYTQGATVAITATAADGDGSVAYVDFYDGGALLASDTTAPYAFNWATSTLTPTGNHSITAVAVDNNGASTVSAARSITINGLSNTADSDGDGIADALDLYPNDASRGEGILREQFNAIGGGVLVSDLTSAAKFPNAPDVVARMTTFTSPDNIADNYGTRIRGIFTAPQTGAYTFWVAGDDEVRLFLSTDNTEANKRQIASVPGWSFSNEWTKYPEQRSATINLTAGQNYYIETLHKEGGGGDGVAVAWQTPSNATRTIITDQFFQRAGAGGGGTGAINLPTGVVGAWAFNEGAGVTVADASGNNRPLTLNNNSWLAGIGGQAAQFNGVNTFGTAGQALVDTAASFSVSAWVKLDNLNGWQTFVNQDGVNVSGFWLQFSQFVNGNKFMLSMHDVDSTASTPFRAVSSTTPVVGQWYHVVGVRDKSAATMKIYVNGQLEGTTTYTGGWTATGALNVGRGRWVGPNDWVAGAIDGVSVYNRALTDSDITGLYQARDSGGVISPPANMAPSVTLTAPVSGSSITQGDTVTITATATDSDGTVARVEFFDGASLLGADTTAPFTFNWVTSSSTSTGVRNLTARAYDNTGAVTTSPAVNVTVNAMVATGPRPSSSTAITYETRTNASGRVWVVNPDNDSISVLDASTNALLREIPVGTAPRTLAIAPNGNIWVANKGSASISVVSPTTLSVVQTISLPRASQPYGVAFAPNGTYALVVLEALGQVRKLDSATGALVATLGVGSNPRHVSITADSAIALVSRFITPPLPGESTANVDTTTAGAEVVAVNASNLTLNKTIVLRHSDKADTTLTGSGIPNYLGAAAISPDGQSAWVPSKQDNIKRGMARSGQPLNFQNTVRAISSRIDMGTLTEDYASRVDHDNSSLGSAAVFHPSGEHLIVALETSREVVVIDPSTGLERVRINVGRAPQGLALSPDGNTLYVQEFMDRSVAVVDLTQAIANGAVVSPVTRVVFTVPLNQEKLPANVLLGKQLFYDARDRRLALDSYMSCASCHNDGGHDGRVWDLTGFGEGLRNTVALKGRAGMAHGNLHWSANFDEVQDFEAQIRALAGGTGLMTNEQFNTGTRNQPLGDRKAGVSTDLDNLAAYVTSLNTFSPSPNRNANGTLTTAATTGRTVFANSCASCHGGANFTQSSDASNLKNIGTMNALSGQRLGATLTGIDAPTLRDAWATAPYLHNGSAPTLTAAVQAHNNLTLSATDIANVVAFVQQIGSEEPGVLAGLPNTDTDGDGIIDALDLYPNDAARGAGIWREQYNAIGGGVLVSDLTSAAKFPNAPDVVARMSTFTSPDNIADNYGTRIRGIFRAPETGSYTFWVAGDDEVRLFLSTDHTPSNRIQIAAVPGWSFSNEWTKYPAQRSLPVALVAGQHYYLEVLHKEGGGGDGVAVAWQTPSNSTRTVITSQHFPQGNATQPPANVAPTVAITAPTTGGIIIRGATVAITATAADSDGSIARVEFYDGATLLGTDTTAPYAFSWATNATTATGAHSLTARAYDNAGAVTTSAAVSVTVNSTTPPASSIFCANENGTCRIPTGRTATVWYGANTSWAVRTGVSVSIGCNNRTFGDPIRGTVKSCRYLAN